MQELKNMNIINIQGIECYEQDGKAYLKLETVARGLGFTETAASGNECVMWRRIRKYLEDLKFIGTCADGKNLPDFIPENIFYRLAMKAKNETAERFQAKVADEIIPSIRKHGGYISGQENMTDDELLERAILVAQRKIAERDKKITQLEHETVKMSQIITEMQPKADYVDVVLKNKSTVCTTQIAQDYGMTANRFNCILRDMGIQRKVGKQWILYADYLPMGYVQSETVDITRSDGTPDTVMHTKWTPKGRLFLYEELKKSGYIPLIEKEIR